MTAHLVASGKRIRWHALVTVTAVTVFVVSAHVRPPATDYAAGKLALLVQAVTVAGAAAYVLRRPGAVKTWWEHTSVYSAVLSVAILTTGTTRGGGRAAPWDLNPNIAGRYAAFAALYGIVNILSGNVPVTRTSSLCSAPQRL